jgi:hypothetical protein
MSTTEDAANEPKQYVIGRVREALSTDPRVNELDVAVTVSGRKVFLTGEVTTAERRDAVTIVVSEILPEHEIHNETTVRHYPERREPEALS